MQIRHLVPLAGINGSIRPGEVREVGGAEGERLIEAGYAEPFDADAEGKATPAAAVDWNKMKVDTLRVVARDLDIPGHDKLKKPELVAAVEAATAGTPAEPLDPPPAE